MTLYEYCTEVVSTIDGLDDQGRAELTADHVDDLLIMLATIGHFYIDPHSTVIGPILRESVSWLRMLLATRE
jgi:hypothetical protein